QQQREIQSLRTVIEKSNVDNTTARSGVRPADAAQPASLTAAPPVAVAANQTPATGKNETAEQSQKHVEELYRRFGSLRFSGDIRFRYEGFYNQGFDALAETP